MASRETDWTHCMRLAHDPASATPMAADHVDTPASSVPWRFSYTTATLGAESVSDPYIAHGVVAERIDHVALKLLTAHELAVNLTASNGGESVSINEDIAIGSYADDTSGAAWAGAPTTTLRDRYNLRAYTAPADRVGYYSQGDPVRGGNVTMPYWETYRRARSAELNTLTFQLYFALVDWSTSSGDLTPLDAWQTNDDQEWTFAGITPTISANVNGGFVNVGGSDNIGGVMFLGREIGYQSFGGATLSGTITVHSYLAD